MDIEQSRLDQMSYPPLARLAIEAFKQHPMGLSEYELIQWIKKHGDHIYESIDFWDRLSLFQTHFMLFHTLYQLKTLFAESNAGRLDINPLRIVLLPPDININTDIANYDPLQEYYLDITHLDNTTDREIADLLAKFWQAMGNPDKRAAALSVLELEDPVEFSVIKQQHRRLVMKHHPDRGGSKEKLQSINTAMDILKQLQNDKQS
jgi:hypothetical protein